MLLRLTWTEDSEYQFCGDLKHFFEKGDVEDLYRSLEFSKIGKTTICLIFIGAWKFQNINCRLLCFCTNRSTPYWQKFSGLSYFTSLFEIEQQIAK